VGLVVGEGSTGLVGPGALGVGAVAAAGVAPVTGSVGGLGRDDGVDPDWVVAAGGREVEVA
jgi:hypothetical protein